MRGGSRGIFGWFRLQDSDFSSSDMLRTRGSGRVLRGEGGVTIPGIVSSLLAPEASPFLHAFNWGELGQGDSVDLHGIGVSLGTGRVVVLRGDLSFLKGKDSHFLGMEDLGLINPSSDGGRDGRHGEDHGGDPLINPKRELVNEMIFLLDSRLERKVLEVSDILLESIISGSILLEGFLHKFGEFGAGSGFGVKGVEGSFKILDEFVEGLFGVGDQGISHLVIPDLSIGGPPFIAHIVQGGHDLDGIHSVKGRV